MKTRPSLTIAVAGLAATLIVPAGALLSPASATTDGSFGVSVIDDRTEAPLAGATVKLFSTATGLQVKSTLTTDDEGQASFTGLGDGGYTAQVSKTGYYAEFSTVETINDDNVSVGRWIGLNAVAESTGRVRGTVTRLGHASFSGSVRAFASSVTQADIDDESAGPVASTSTGNDGAWGLKLRPGSYKVQVQDYDNGETRWIGGTTADNATSVVVTAGGSVVTATVTFPSEEVVSPDRIVGTVSGAGLGAIGDVQVFLYATNATGRGDYITSTSTDAAGRFAFSVAETVPSEYHCFDDEVYYPSEQAAIDAGCTNGHWHYDEGPIPAGDYKLGFADPRGEFTGEYYNDVPIPTVDDPATEDVYEPEAIPAAAATITLGATGSVNTAPVLLATSKVTAPTSGIKGRVVDAAGKGVAAYIEVYNAATGSYAGDAATRRDGTWAIPATELPPGSYKVRIGSEAYRNEWVGGVNAKTAAVQVVPIKGVKDVGPVTVYGWSAVTGKVTVPPVAGLDRADRSVYLYDEDGGRVDSTDTAPDGSYSFGGLPGGTYYVSATGSRYSVFDDDGYQSFIPQFFAGKYSLGTATPIVVKDGATARSVNITLGSKLLAVSAPRITGTTKVGKTLAGSVGVWNRKVDTRFSYQWRRGSTVVGRASTYKITAKDAGTKLTFVVTATNRYGDYATGTAASAPVSIPKATKKKR